MEEALDCGLSLRVDKAVVESFELAAERGYDAHGEARVRLESGAQARPLFVHEDLNLLAVLLARLRGAALGLPFRSFFCVSAVVSMRLPIIALEPADADGCLHGPIIGRGAHDETLPTGRVNLIAAKADDAGMAPEMLVEKGMRCADRFEDGLRGRQDAHSVTGRHILQGIGRFATRNGNAGFLGAVRGGFCGVRVVDGWKLLDIADEHHAPGAAHREQGKRGRTLRRFVHDQIVIAEHVAVVEAFLEGVDGACDEWAFAKEFRSGEGGFPAPRCRSARYGEPPNRL